MCFRVTIKELVLSMPQLLSMETRGDTVIISGDTIITKSLDTNVYNVTIYLRAVYMKVNKCHFNINLFENSVKLFA